MHTTSCLSLTLRTDGCAQHPGLRSPRGGRRDGHPEDAAPAPGTHGPLALHAARVAFPYGECNTRAEHGSGSPATPWLQIRHPALRPLVLTKTTSSNSTAMKLKRDGY